MSDRSAILAEMEQLPDPVLLEEDDILLPREIQQEVIDLLDAT
jgi:hypothetical protein